MVVSPTVDATPTPLRKLLPRINEVNDFPKMAL